MRFCSSSCVLLTVCLSVSATAATIAVPLDYVLIAEAIAAASAGDTIAISPGVYAEHTLSLVPDVSIVGVTGDPGDVVIDAQYQGRIFSAAYTSGIYVSGITMRNGFSGYHEGGGLFLRSCSVVFESCVLEDCTAYDLAGGAYIWDTSGVLRDVVVRRNSTELGGHDGGGIYSLQSDILMERVTFDSNSSTGSGGGLFIRNTITPTLIDVEFIGNTGWQGAGLRCYDASTPITGAIFVGNSTPTGGEGGGLFCGPQCAPVLTDVIFEDNSATYGGGVACRDGGDVEVEYGVFFNNHAEIDGGGIFANNASPVLTNVTLCSNSAGTRGGNVFLYGSSSLFARVLVAFSASAEGIYSTNGYPLLTCSDVFGNAGGDYAGGVPDQTGLVGNISEDPMLCDLSLGDLEIAEQSPCAPANNSCGYLIGAKSIGCAPSAVQETSWGALKALYR